ncbi:MAG: PEP-utilizing enzyme [Candidatus Veblenbacteria bacterium]|nr:PEP-utilizing enzyme [Candidatus Veblenbacteria bacterium]
MKLPGDYKQTIEEAIRGDWYFLTKRADIFILPVWLKVGFSSRSRECHEVFGTNISWLLYWQNNEIELYLHAPEYRKAILNVTPRLYSLAGVKKQTQRLFAYCEDATKRATAFYDRDLSTYSNEKLLKLYKTIIEPYGLSFVNGFFTWCSQVLQKQVRSAISNYEKKLEKLGLTKDEALGVLINFEEITYYKQKEKALDELAKAFSEEVAQLPKLTANAVRRQSRPLDKKIKSFLSKYKWVGFDYNGPVITYEEVLKSVVQRDEKDHKKIAKSAIISACKFSPTEIEAFKAMSLVSYAKDLRNQTDDYLHYCLDSFFKEVGRRFGLTLSEVKYLWPEELVALLKGEGRYPRKYINQKKEHSMVISLLDGDVTHIYRYVGQEAKDLKEKIFSAKSADEKEPPVVRQEIKGMVASPGKVKGRARIVLSYRDINKVGQGDILVAYMTSPRFMPAIVRCGAIVTNDGGLTCHAAIIARELKKPCVIGTKVATKFLKDGDMVEVDAEAGIVRKI